MQTFDVKNVPLIGKNLVEASAGTGKTYSIAILVLRLLLQPKPVVTNSSNSSTYFTIEEILIVTYTKAAVAELQERIRNFIKLAVNHCNGLQIEDMLIATIVNRQIEQEAQAAVLERLKKAMFSLDEANIMTIHGFTQKMLQEFAFESKQSFATDLQNDISAIIETFSNEYYRKSITTLPLSTLALIDGLSIKNELPTIFTNVLSEKHFYIQEDSLDIATALKHLQECKAANDANLLFASDYLSQHKSEVISSLQAALKSAPEWFAAVMNDVNAFIDVAEDRRVKKKTKAYFKLSGSFWDAVNAIIDQKDIQYQAQRNLENAYKNEAINEMLPKIQQAVQQSGILTFDAMILNLKNVLLQEKDERLAQLIRNKFPAVFIDEFQDTDRTQFEIFNHLFIQNDQGILFLIGDPKQSIYSFRNADIDSYLEAKSKVHHIYSMNTNFRSTQDMVTAVNTLYESIGYANAFGYNDATPEHKRIEYEVVKSNDTNAGLYRNGKPVQEVFVLDSFSRTNDATQGLANKISFMLNPKNNFQLLDKKTQELRALRPNDFGVLVYNKFSGKNIKSHLQSFNIPAVQLLDEKVLQTSDAKELHYIYEAMLEPNIANIRKALYLTFLEPEHTTNDAGWIFKIDENNALMLFASYHQLMIENNVYQAFIKLLDDFSIRQRFSHNTAALRRLTNIEQIIQLINDQQYQKGKDYNEVLLWLKKSYNGLENEGDAYMVQLESDEDAVKISTIHSSKGLEYNIVFIFGIHQTSKIRKKSFVEFKLNNEANRYFAYSDDINATIESQILQASEEELTRLMYVAFTRSVYFCNVFFPYSNNALVRYSGSTLQKYVNIIETIHSPFIGVYSDSTYAPIIYQVSKDDLHIQPITFNYKNAILSKTNWWKMSFSALTMHESLIYEKQPLLEDDYNQFVFNELPRGTQAGISLHSLFENLDFTIDYSNDDNINWFYKKQFDVFNNEDGTVMVDYAQEVRQMVMHILKAKIAFPNEASFTLSEIADVQKINEMEFAFHLKVKEQTATLLQILNEQNARIQISEQGLEGMMNGFIDLFFEHNGKYYILDWKSNYIGFELQDYTFEKLDEAMTLSNYHLQYLIYTTAICKFLKSRNPQFNYETDFGGVIYVFLRGVRAGNDSGIFTHKPQQEVIAQLLQILD